MARYRSIQYSSGFTGIPAGATYDSGFKTLPDTLYERKPLWLLLKPKFANQSALLIECLGSKIKFNIMI